MKVAEFTDEIKDKKQWENKGYELPSYDRAKVIEKTYQEPVWVHFGAGNIFRAFPAAVLDKMIQNNQYDHGVIVAEAFDPEILTKAYEPCNNVSILVQLNSDGTCNKRIIQSVTEALHANLHNQTDYTRLKQIFCSKSLQMVSFTITEKGYTVSADDVERGPKDPNQIIGILTALLHERFLHGAAPIALVSMDNCSHNGEKLQNAVLSYANEWSKKAFVDQEFIDYLSDPKKVSFPWTMIDKITPRPDPNIEHQLIADGIEDAAITQTSRHTYIAPFVCAEETEYLVIEDTFPNGRPPLELGGFLFTTRETVDQAEKMKVCTCLNPLHTALAIFGCLLGYDRINEEMKDSDLRGFVRRMAYEEGMPVVVDPKILSPKEFLDTVLTKRLPNPYLPDTPQRIATDTSQKLPIRFGETLKAYRKQNKDMSKLKFLPLVLAGYARYLSEVDDQLKPFAKSPDPKMEELSALVAGIEIGTGVYKSGSLEGYLRRSDLFGVDLYECNLAHKVEMMFAAMVRKPGAVREVLHKYVENSK